MPRFKKAPAVLPRLADDIYEQILSAILEGDIAPGERIVQETIAREINVSRTPVREALLRLEHERIIEGSSRHGFSIRRFSEAEAQELYVAREAVEGYAARWIAESGDEAKLASVADAIRLESEVAPSEARAYFEVNRQIHRTIVRQVDNQTLVEMFDGIWNRGISLTLFALTLPEIERRERPLTHDVLLDALGSGDPERAYGAMIEHIREGLAALTARL